MPKPGSSRLGRGGELKDGENERSSFSKSFVQLWDRVMAGSRGGGNYF